MSLKTMLRLVLVPAVLGLVAAGVLGYFVSIHAALAALVVGFGASIALAVLLVVVAVVLALSSLTTAVNLLWRMVFRMFVFFDDDGGEGGGDELDPDPEVLYDATEIKTPQVFPVFN